MKEITIDLECELTQEELNDRAQKMSSSMLTYDEIEDRKKDVAKNMAEEMSSLRDQMRLYSLAIRKKTENRPVICRVQFHSPELGMKRIIRNDTGEIVRDETMSYEERQSNLFDDIQEMKKMFGSGPEAEPEAPAKA